MKTFTCKSSVASKNGGFVSKMVGTHLEEVFGTSKEVKETYYIKTKGPIVVDSVHQVDLEAKFEITLRDFELENEDGSITTIPLKWLTIKGTSPLPVVAHYSASGTKF